MAQREDFLLDDDGDFPLEDNVVNGVYLPTNYGASDSQHILDGILYTRGSLKQFPTAGFGLIKYEESEFDLDSVYLSLSTEMESDGYKLGNEALSPNPNGGFYIDTDKIYNNY